MAEKKAAEKQAHDFQMTFGLTDEGKLTLAALERFADWERADFIPDAARAAYLQGRRSVIAYIHTQLKGE